MLLDLPDELLKVIFVHFLQMKKSKLICKHLNQIIQITDFNYSEVLYVYSNKELLEIFEKTNDDFLIKYIRVYDCELDYTIKTKRFKKLFRIDLINCCGIKTDNQLKTVLMPKTIIGSDYQKTLFNWINTDSIASIYYKPLSNHINHESHIYSSHIIYNVIIESYEDYDIINKLYLYITSSNIKLQGIIRMSSNKYLLCMFPINSVPYNEIRIHYEFKANIYIEHCNLNHTLRDDLSFMHSDKNGWLNPYFRNFDKLKYKEGMCGIYLFDEMFIENTIEELINMNKYKIIIREIKDIIVESGSINLENNFSK